MIGPIYVYGDWNTLKSPTLIGKLNVESLRGKEVFSFEYDERWLESKEAPLFDPDLQFFKGRQYPSNDKHLFGIFADSCPDRWGRMLLQRNEAITAKRDKRPPRKLSESDFLIGIEDFSRMGALRFKINMEGEFLSESNEDSVPIWTNIRELEQAAVLLESSNNIDGPYAQRLRLLLKPGSSLGGARPKASVRDTDGNLWIAKFPSKNDDLDVGAWEMVVHELAARCNLNTPKATHCMYSNNGTTFLVQRFDRTKGNARKHFISAMTALGETDGAGYDSGTSYLDIASYIQQFGSSPTGDLKELWKRIVFNIAVTNTDDHLRNHGFLFDSRGLSLSPLYDVNPNPNGIGLSLNIDEYDNSLDFDIAIDASKYYCIPKDDAAREVKEMKQIISSWSVVADRIGISHSQISEMECCFKC